MSANEESIEAPVTDDDDLLSEQDKADLKALAAEDGTVQLNHTLLRIWKEVLAPACKEVGKNVTPQWASQMIQTYRGITFSDCNELRDRYYSKLFVLMDILDAEIESDDLCLEFTEPGEDLEHNGVHYKNLLANWQKQFLTWELEWRCDQSWAAVELAALSEVHKILFGSPERQGLTAFLENIKFEWHEDDQRALGEELEAMKLAAEEER